MRSFDRTALQIDFYEPYQSGAQAPYDPGPEDYLPGESRIECLKRIFLASVAHNLKSSGEKMVMGFSDEGTRLSTLAPPESVIELARGMPFVRKITLEHL